MSRRGSEKERGFGEKSDRDDAIPAAVQYANMKPKTMHSFIVPLDQITRPKQFHMLM